MITFGQQLFSDLMALCSVEGSPFYFIDQKHNEKSYRIFGYRLASYTDFLQPGALECRGHTFEINDLGEFVRLVSIPFKKFFNDSENPFTMDVDYTHTQLITGKLDGSLISISMVDGQFLVKSKMSFTSPQAADARNYIESNESFKKILQDVFQQLPDATINCEFTAPWNRIVILYPEVKLTVLQMRSNLTGEPFPYDLLQRMIPAEYLVSNVLPEVENVTDFVQSIYDMEDIEGFVFTLQSGQQIKVKCNQYLVLHRAVDSLQMPKHLFECVVAEAHDDLRAIMKDSPDMLARIDSMEAEVKKIYQIIDNTAIKFYNDNRQLSKKDYAIKGKAELAPMFFVVAIELYIGREFDYKEFLVKHWKDWNIKDTWETVDTVPE